MMTRLFCIAALWLALSFVCSATAALTAQQDPERCDEIDRRVTTTPTIPQFASSLRRHLVLMGKLPRGPLDLLLVGDSLVAGWDLEALHALKGKSIYDFGVGGDRTQNLLWRLQDARLAELRPRNVLLLIGTNNLATDDKPCAILAGIDAVIERMRMLWADARPLIVLIPPRGADWKFQDAQRREVNARLRERAAEQGWPVVDADAALTCGFTQPCANYEPDRLHITPAGYRKLTALVTAALGW